MRRWTKTCAACPPCCSGGCSPRTSKTSTRNYLRKLRPSSSSKFSRLCKCSSLPASEKRYKIRIRDLHFSKSLLIPLRSRIAGLRRRRRSCQRSDRRRRKQPVARVSSVLVPVRQRRRSRVEGGGPQNVHVSRGPVYVFFCVRLLFIEVFRLQFRSRSFRKHAKPVFGRHKANAERFPATRRTVLCSIPSRQSSRCVRFDARQRDQHSETLCRLATELYAGIVSFFPSQFFVCIFDLRMIFFIRLSLKMCKDRSARQLAT